MVIVSLSSFGNKKRLNKRVRGIREVEEVIRESMKFDIHKIGRCVEILNKALKRGEVTIYFDDKISWDKALDMVSKLRSNVRKFSILKVEVGSRPKFFIRLVKQRKAS